MTADELLAHDGRRRASQPENAVQPKKRAPMHRITAAMAMALTLGGCAFSTGNEGTYKFSDGWREAKVLEVGPANTLTRPVSSDCRALAAAVRASALYASVEYKRMGRRATRTLPIAADDRVKPGDLVYVRIDHCEPSLPMRIG